jgi:GntR family transcriptional regulator
VPRAAASAPRPVEHHRQVAELARHPGRAEEELPAREDRPSEAGGHGEIDEVVDAAGGAERVLAERRDVCVALHEDRQAEATPQWRDKVEIAITGAEVRRTKERATARVERAYGGDAHGDGLGAATTEVRRQSELGDADDRIAELPRRTVIGGGPDLPGADLATRQDDRRARPRGSEIDRQDRPGERLSTLLDIVMRCRHHHYKNMNKSPATVNTSPSGVDRGRFSPGVLKRGPIPLHHQLYLKLTASLDEGRWVTGDRLPTERELAQSFDCSLITVRRALDELRRERRIMRSPGRGTFVTSPPVERDLTALTSFTQEMRARGLDPETRLIAAATVKAAADVVAALHLRAGDETLFIERVRSVGGRPLLLEQVYLPISRFPGLPVADLERGSLYELLAKQYGVQPVRGQETIEPILPNAREAGLLEQSARRPALLIELVAYAADDSPVEYCRAIVRGDRARYRVDARGSRLDALHPEQPQE